MTDEQARLDDILHEINSAESLTTMLMNDRVFENGGARETALVRTKLQEAWFWAEEAKRKIVQED